MSDDDFDDLPETHLADDDYDEFLAREFDRDGGLRDEPPVARYILMLVVLIAIVIVLVFF
jgi:hypothetical protein